MEHRETKPRSVAHLEDAAFVDWLRRAWGRPELSPAEWASLRAECERNRESGRRGTREWVWAMGVAVVVALAVGAVWWSGGYRPDVVPVDAWWDALADAQATASVAATTKESAGLLWVDWLAEKEEQSNRPTTDPLAQWPVWVAAKAVEQSRERFWSSMSPEYQALSFWLTDEEASAGSVEAN